MIEVLLLFLLLWLWVIERRLNTANSEIRTLRLDLDGLRAIRKAPPPKAPEENPGLPEVTSLGRSAKAVREAAKTTPAAATAAS